MRKLELLIPAGSLDVLKTAVLYGADAVYLGGEAFGLRAKAKKSKRALRLPMSAASKYILQQIFLHIMMI